MTEKELGIFSFPFVKTKKSTPSLPTQCLPKRMESYVEAKIQVSVHLMSPELCVNLLFVRLSQKFHTLQKEPVGEGVFKLHD